MAFKKVEIVTNELETAQQNYTYPMAKFLYNIPFQQSTDETTNITQMDQHSEAKKFSF